MDSAVKTPPLPPEYLHERVNARPTDKQARTTVTMAGPETSDPSDA
jgi:hypothetical protein